MSFSKWFIINRISAFDLTEHHTGPFFVEFVNSKGPSIADSFYVTKQDYQS